MSLKQSFSVNGINYQYYSLPALERGGIGQMDRLPFSIRVLLENLLRNRDNEVITDDQIEALRTVHAGYTGDDDQAYTRYTDENRRFHYLLALASGNQELALALRALHDRLSRFMVMRHAGPSLESIHARLIERLEAHDAAGARKAILEEVRESRRAILERILQDEAANWHVGTGRITS